MEKRLLLAVVLMTLAIVVTNLIFPPPEPSVAPAVEEPVGVSAPAGGRAEVADAGASAALPTPGAGSAVAGDSVVVETELYRYVFSTRGVALLRAELLQYPSYVREGMPVQLVPTGSTEFLAYRLVVGQDTVDLRQLPFEVSARALRPSAEDGERSLVFSYREEGGFELELEYGFDPGGYLVEARGRIAGLAGRPARLLTELAPGLELHEHPDHHSERELAVVTRIPGSVDRLPFRRVEGSQPVNADLTWAGIKDKYFLVAVIAGDGPPLQGAIVEDVPDYRVVLDGGEVVLPQVRLTPIVAVAPDGSFAIDFYLGPQDYAGLSAIGFDLQEVTPYGYRWLQPVIRPLAAAVLWVLNGLHESLGIAYGWVLVIFGVIMRIVLWPLNAKAMRAQMKNMAVQPLLQEIKDEFKGDPQKQQEAMLSLYKEHGFNPLAGCLPMLVPFPVLITLFFVFQNTIAFRGAAFLWLPDLSLRDPLYILPFVLVVSMFALQWVSAHLSGIEQNPQMKMMMYFMPVMMGVIFFMLPAGLNLYYAVTQVASVPQQVLIARERQRAQLELKKSGGPKLSVPSGAGRTKSKAKR